jgi:uncharacterized protein (DUF427 family)
VPDQRRVRVEFAGVVIAETRNALRCPETASPPTFYLPPTDVDPNLIVPAAGSSWCEWKGRARYWSVRVGDRVAANSAWSYLAPEQRYAELAGYLSFYPARVDRCLVDGEIVRPQEGGFYGGWVTDDIVGPWKGAPGTEGW